MAIRTSPSVEVSRLPQQAASWRLRRRAVADEGAFNIPSAPILIPPGPWKEIDGSVTAPKGFKAQGRPADSFLSARLSHGQALAERCCNARRIPTFASLSTFSVVHQG